MTGPVTTHVGEIARVKFAGAARAEWWAVVGVPGVSARVGGDNSALDLPDPPCDRAEMPKNWLLVRVELLAGAPVGTLWPPPARVLLVGPRHTFADLAEAVEGAFARWDRAHLWEFTLADGRRIAPPDPDEPAEDAGRLTVRDNVDQDAAFRYLFDLGDEWVHRCTVVDAHVDPVDVWGGAPERPTSVDGWGSLPDQYGRLWETDDGDSDEPPPPAAADPMLSHDWPAGQPADSRSLRGDDLRELRGATYRRDREAVRALLTEHDPDGLLQHIGDALLAVGIDGMEDVAHTVELRLRERDDEGDAELADALAGRLGGPAPMLRPIPVELDSVAELMNGDPGMSIGGWVDLQTGQTWPEEILDNLDEEDRPAVDAEPDRWWFVRCEGSHASWRDRHDFASGLPPGPLRDRLIDALDGRGAFRRFARVMDALPELLAEWRAFGHERATGRARALLAAHGYTPAPRQPPP
jgi:hypothetical protein